MLTAILCVVAFAVGCVVFAAVLAVFAAMIGE
jgi:hypothetical protein